MGRVAARASARSLSPCIWMWRAFCWFSGGQNIQFLITGNARNVELNIQPQMRKGSCRKYKAAVLGQGIDPWRVSLSYRATPVLNSVGTEPLGAPAAILSEVGRSTFHHSPSAGIGLCG